MKSDYYLDNVMGEIPTEVSKIMCLCLLINCVTNARFISGSVDFFVKIKLTKIDKVAGQATISPLLQSISMLRIP